MYGWQKQFYNKGCIVKRLRFDYFMKIEYSEPVSLCHFTIKCFPKNTLRQKPEGVSVALSPAVPYSIGADAFGNRQIYGRDDIVHHTFSFRITGSVRTGNLLWEEEADEDLTSVFRYPHGLNRAGEKLRAYHHEMADKFPEDVYEKGLFLMHELYRDFNYEKGVTEMHTTAEEAFCLGKGVCQDYAHILIALLQMEGIPARYVTGMLIGEGASHAWVEVLYQGRWYGLDPTNDSAVTDAHIKIGVGRDASDCLINRGIMHGGGTQKQTIEVIVGEEGLC